jgi:hypothetical protein
MTDPEIDEAQALTRFKIRDMFCCSHCKKEKEFPSAFHYAVEGLNFYSSNECKGSYGINDVFSQNCTDESETTDYVCNHCGKSEGGFKKQSYCEFGDFVIVGLKV